MSETKLKRCPFCGEKMVPSHKLLKHPNGYLKWFRFHPDNECFLSAHLIDLRETERVEAWNTRKPMENIVERLEEEPYINKGGELFLNGNNEDCLPLRKVFEIVKEEGELHEI